MNKIETYIKNMERKQKYLMYFVIFGLIIYVFVQFMIPMRNEQVVLQGKVDELQTKLVGNSLSRLKKQKKAKIKELFLLKNRQEKQKERINYLISGLYKLKYAFYDDKEWAKSMDDILKYSLRRNLKIEYVKTIDTKPEKNSGMIKKRKSLEISGSGNYIDIVAFISYIDNLNTLLQFRKVDINSATKGVNFMLFIDMYGIGL